MDATTNLSDRVRELYKDERAATISLPVSNPSHINPN